MRFLPLCLALSVLPFATPASFAAAPADLPPVTPPAGHPRLLLRSHELPALRAALHEPELSTAWSELRRRAILPPDYQPLPRYDLAVMRAAEANAFLSMAEENPAAARRAIELAFLLLGADGPAENLGYFGRQAVGTCLFTVAKVYDWCHAALTPDERLRLCALMREHAAVMEIKFPPVTTGSIAGHSSGMQLLRDQLAMAIATFDEDPEIYEIVAGRFYREYDAPRDFFYPGHFHHQGNAYGMGRFDCEVWAALLLTRMGAPAPWSLSAMAQVPYFYLYLRRPDGGMVKDGDDYFGLSRPAGSYWGSPAAHWLHFTGLFRDPQFVAQWHRQLATVETRFTDRDDPASPVLTILLRPDRIAPASLENLPLSRYFREPLGAIVARTGWNIGADSRDVVAYLKIGTHRFDNHQHADSGQFQLFYRGTLALDSGIYQSSDTGYGQPHHRNYFRRTVAHNTLLIEEPSERFSFDGTPIGNDGGQRTIEPAETMENFWHAPTRTGRVVSRFIGHHPTKPELSLIKGDLTTAYSDLKARRVSRTMAFLPLDDTRSPAALIVLDRVESVRPDQRKVALLHSIEEPQIDANVTTVTRTSAQVNILRLAPENIDRASDNAAEATLTFDLRSLADAKILQAELFCRVPWSQTGELHVASNTGQLANVKMSNASPVPLPDVTAWLQAAARSPDNRANLTVTRVGGDTRGVLESVEGPHAPHLRVWIEAAPSAGKLVQTTLLPDAKNLELRKVGGPGREFLAGEQNWPATPAIAEPLSGTEAGAWRVEIGDRSGESATRFLNVYQVMDADASPAPVRLLRNRGVIGASVGGRMLVASDTDDWLAAGAIVEVQPSDVHANGLALVALTDLPPGDHSLWQGDVLEAAGVVEPHSHTWLVSLRPGRYELKSR